MAAAQKTDLTIIMISFSTKQVTLDCIASIYKNKTSKDRWQVIVVDNGSTDGSVEAIRKEFPQVEVYPTGENLGFSKGNNYARPYTKGETILFLNNDTIIVGDVIQKSLEFLHSDKKIGALNCRIELPDGTLDYSSHRGFPTPMNSLMYFTGMAKLFPHSKFFAGYTATYLDISKTHEIDCGCGAFLMVPKTVCDKINWWDTDYFWNGEDIQFFYDVKKLGYKVFFFTGGKIIHYKGSSSGLQKTAKTNIPQEKRIRTAIHAAQAMRIFVKKNYYPKMLPVWRDFVMWGITCMEKYRIAKIKTGLKYS